MGKMIILLLLFLHTALSGGAATQDAHQGVFLGITIVIPSVGTVGLVNGTTAPPAPRSPGMGRSARVPACPATTDTAGATQSPAGTTARAHHLEEEDQSMTLQV